MVRSVARGQFRVTWAADELTSIDDLRGANASETLPEDDTAPVPPAVPLPKPALPHGGRLMLDAPEAHEPPPRAPLGRPDLASSRGPLFGPRSAPVGSPLALEGPASSPLGIPLPRATGEDHADVTRDHDGVPTVPGAPVLRPSVAVDRLQGPEPFRAPGGNEPIPLRARPSRTWLNLPPLGSIEEEEEDTEAPATGTRPQEDLGSAGAPTDVPEPSARKPQGGAPSGEGAAPTPSTPGPAVAAAGPLPVSSPQPSPATGPSRTLVGLLARMWLMRAGTAATGGVALAGPAPAGPQPPSTAPAPPSLEPPAPPQPPPRPTVEEVTPRLSLPPPDFDDQRPLSGLATFLVEVAEIAHPSRPRDGGGLPGLRTLRTHIVVRLIHCRSRTPARLVSRDACHQPRYGR